MNSNYKISKMCDYLKSVINLSDEEIDMIKLAMNITHELCPSDIPGVFSRINKLISASEDLSWVIYCVNKKLDSIKSDIKRIKDPNFVMLVRQGRPSTQAIESEIRFNNDELVNMEDNLDTINNILEYLNHIELTIDRSIWLCQSVCKHS